MSREIFAWIAKDPDGTEGIVMVPDHEGNAMPLVSVEERVARVGRPYLEAHDVAARRGAPIRLVRFLECDIIDVIEPPKPASEAR